MPPESRSRQNGASQEPSPRSAVTPSLAGAALPARKGFEEGAALCGGRYRIGRKLGAGGMGVVYLATDTRLRGEIALKALELDRLPDPEGAVTRLFQEARVGWKVTLLEHPNVVRLYDIEQDPGTSTWFLTMEYVEGENLWQLMKRKGKLPLEEAIGYVKQVLKGLALAHQHGVVHRDLKPSNLLMAKDGLVKIADFGLSKVVTEQAGALGVTRNVSLLGTIEYMAPEQWEDPKAVDQRADVFSVGAILYELLTAKRPMGHFKPPSLKAEVPAWIDGPVLKALAADPEDRFQSATEFLVTLERGPQGHKGDGDEEIPMATLVDVGGDEPAAGAPSRHGAPSFQLAHALRGRFGEVHSVAFSPDGRVLAWGAEGPHDQISLLEAATGRLLLSLSGHSDPISSIAFSPDGRALATASWDKAVKIWDVETGKKILARYGHPEEVYSVAYHPDGRRLASASWDRTVNIWDLDGGKILRTLAGHAGGVFSVAFSPDGAIVASGSWDKTVRLWDADSGQLLRTLAGHTHSVYSVAWAPKGKLLASGSWDGTVSLWHPDGREVRMLRGSLGRVYSVAFSPDGHFLASAGRKSAIEIWSVADGALVASLPGHSGRVYSVAFSPDGNHLASGSDDETIRIWKIL